MRALSAALLYSCAAVFPRAVAAQDVDDSTSYESPPVYPAPNTTGAGNWNAALSKANDFLDQLTLDEKIWIVTGSPGPCVGALAPIPRLGFKGLCIQDGPLAIREADFASVFPAGLSAAASWDRDLIHRRGLLLGKEFRAKGAHVALGPVVGPLGRNALGGRNWEGFSPDPYLSGVAVSETVLGMQSTGLQACVKHYMGNEQETQRLPTLIEGTRIESLSSNIDDRTIHELYSWPFADAVKAGVASVMCSYNRINGSYACQNSKTLNGILKEELGFQGYVVSDWGGTRSSFPAMNAGQDLNMPGEGVWGGNISIALNNGSLELSRLDDMVRRVMTPYFFLGQDQDYPDPDPSGADIIGFNPSNSPYQWPLNGPRSRDVREDHATFIRELGAASATLLKNTDNTLPLSAPPRVIGVFGNDAADLTDGLVSTYVSADGTSHIGTLAVGGGSGTGRMMYVVSPLDAIKSWARPAGSVVQYITNNDRVATNLSILYPLPELCFVFLKTFATEAGDRTTFDVDSGGNSVVELVAGRCNNTIVVTHSAGPNTMPWADNPNVTAIIAAHLPGQESGNSILDVLTGAVNPSGKLPFTIGYEASDYNAPITNETGTTDPNGWQADFTEGLMIDYRHFDAEQITPRYEFGFGLSYTTFSISGLSVSGQSNTTALPDPNLTIAPGGNPALFSTLATATFSVSNTGSVAGATVPQLYLAFPNGTTPAGTPPQVLRGFDKIMLAPGEAQSVTLSLTRKDVSFWSVQAQQWEIPAGAFEVRVGLSSRDIKETSTISFIS